MPAVILIRRLDQLASLCDELPQHEDEVRAVRRGLHGKGCDVFGRPLDPDHSWNRERGGKV